MKLIVKTVEIEVPGPFTDADAEALIEAVDAQLSDAIEDAVERSIATAKAAGVPLAYAAVFTVSG